MIPPPLQLKTSLRLKYSIERNQFVGPLDNYAVRRNKEPKSPLSIVRLISQAGRLGAYSRYAHFQPPRLISGQECHGESFRSQNGAFGKTRATCSADPLS